jgi:CheY-like chemotaxis protein
MAYLLVIHPKTAEADRHAFVLKKMGYGYARQTSAREAREFIPLMPLQPDCILVDVGALGHDPQLAVDRLRREAPDSAIICLHAADEERPRLGIKGVKWFKWPSISWPAREVDAHWQELLLD